MASTLAFAAPVAAATITISDAASCEARGATFVSGECRYYSGGEDLGTTDVYVSNLNVSMLIFDNAGTATFNAGLGTFGGAYNSGTINVAQEFYVAQGTFTNAGIINVTSGTLSVDGILQNNATIFLSCGVTVTGSGTILGNSVLAETDCDDIAPTASPVATPPANANGWHNSDVTVTWNWADNPGGVGLDPGCSPSATVRSEGTTTLRSFCADLGGKPGEASYTVNLDKSAPTISFVSRTPANAAGWNNTAVNVQWSCADSVSGPVAASVSAIVAGEGASQTATGTCTDLAGNTASEAVQSINIDLTKPTLAPIAPTQVALNSAVTVQPGASDALSGIASASCGAVDTSTAGPKTVTCTATDVAGNTATTNVTVTVAAPVYPWSGFLGPVANPPKVNIVSAGSTVPVTFSLGGYRGKTPFAQGSPVSQQLNCTTGTPIGQAVATTSSSRQGVSYDRRKDRYTYPWSTARSWSGQCRVLTVTLTDGTQHTALFRFPAWHHHHRR